MKQPNRPEPSTMQQVNANVAAHYRVWYRRPLVRWTGRALNVLFVLLGIWCLFAHH